MTQDLGLLLQKCASSWKTFMQRYKQQLVIDRAQSLRTSLRFKHQAFILRIWPRHVHVRTASPEFLNITLIHQGQRCSPQQQTVALDNHLPLKTSFEASAPDETFHHHKAVREKPRRSEDP